MPEDARSEKGQADLGSGIEPGQPREDPRPAAVTFATTEHFTLQGARASTIAESTGRATIFLGAVSGGLVALGLIATASRVGTAFYTFGLVRLPTLAFVGLLTFERVLQSGIEDLGYARRIALLRGYYFDEAPELTPYLMSVPEPERLNVLGLWAGRWQYFRTVAGMVAVITAVITAVLAGSGTGAGGPRCREQLSRWWSWVEKIGPGRLPRSSERRADRMSGADGDLVRLLVARSEAQEALTRVFVCADRRDWDGLRGVLGERVAGRPGVTADRGRVALVSGGARGLGVEICRQLAQAGITVWCTARTIERAEATAELLRSAGDVRAARLDVADDDSVPALAERLDRLDILVNNAAIDYDTDAEALTADLARVRRALDTNLFGAWRTAQAFAAHLRASEHGRLVNVSSQAGSISEMGGGLPAYHVSKLALNGLTRMLAAELRGDGVLVNAVCPGWTATDMAGGGRPVPEGARGVVWACLLEDDGPTGGFFRDGRPLPW